MTPNPQANKADNPGPRRVYGVSAGNGQNCPEDYENRQSTACGRNYELLKPGCAALIIEGPVQDGQYHRVAFTHALTC